MPKIGWILISYLLISVNADINGKSDTTKRLTGQGDLRSDKALSLFNILSFPNVECVSTDSNKGAGVCFTEEECRMLGGTKSGGCASGFGVCCTFAVSSCGDVVQKNITFIQNPGFPSPYMPEMLNPCSFTINKISSDICFIRLDFINMMTSQPPDGQCGENDFDKVSFVSSTGKNPPGPGGLCGNGFGGQHMYLDARSSTPAMITFNLGGEAINNRMWNIKSTQIECGNPASPPQGCVQYFTGSSGNLQSYNFMGGILNSNQLYSSCIRRENGFCKINYSAASDESFSLQGDQGKSQDNAAADACNKAALLIETISQKKGFSEFCGGKFNAGSKQTKNGVVQSDVSPFSVTLRTTMDFANDMKMKGYSLNFVQVPCT